jgi:hypothetical protein
MEQLGLSGAWFYTRQTNQTVGHNAFRLPLRFQAALKTSAS